LSTSLSFAPPDYIPNLSRWLESQSAEDILAFVADRYTPRIAFATGFGPEGCVLLDLIGRWGLPIQVFTLDTGLLFPETYALWRRLEEHTGVRIEGVRPALTVEQQAQVNGERLWERDPDRCCALRKLEPLRAALQGQDAWITAIRRDQTADRADAEVLEPDLRFGLVKVNPLLSWTHEQVWDHLRANDVPVNPLHAQGYPSIGCAPCTSPVTSGEHWRAGRWRARTKTECGLHAGHSEGPIRGPGPKNLSVSSTERSFVASPRRAPQDDDVNADDRAEDGRPVS
jgi:phosphoadenylyl-sulfate reductase (thioredoxin)